MEAIATYCRLPPTGLVTLFMSPTLYIGREWTDNPMIIPIQKHIYNLMDSLLDIIRRQGHTHYLPLELQHATSTEEYFAVQSRHVLPF
jgi:hypothetical protein